CLQGDRPPYSF
nr:immunoglobulin light chain junction region [Macaca mulatta]